VNKALWQSVHRLAFRCGLLDFCKQASAPLTMAGIVLHYLPLTISIPLTTS